MATTQIRTGDQTLVRDLNLTLILNQIRQLSPISRAALSEETGLNKATVSNIVRELIDTELIHEIGFQMAGMGRPAIMLELNPDAGCIISAEIGVDFIAVIRTNFLSEIQWRYREPISKLAGPNLITAQLLSPIKQAMRDAQQCGLRVLGIAVGVPGLVDQNGDVLFAPNLGWHTVALKEMLSAALHTQVYLDNEANMATLGELYFGAAQGYKNVLYLSIGTGLGGGIIYNGRLFTGGAGFAGEFGHMSMDPNGKLCNCGNRGCFETTVSLSAVYDHLRDGLGSAHSDVLTQILAAEEFQFEAVVNAARAGDEVCLQSFSAVGKALGTGVSNLVHAFDPELIVLGGTLSLATDFLLPTMQTELTHRMTQWKRRIPKIVPACHTLDACVIGGIATVYDQIFNFT